MLFARMGRDTFRSDLSNDKSPPWNNRRWDSFLVADQCADALLQFREVFMYQCSAEVAFMREVPIQGALAYSRRQSDVLHACRPDTLCREQSLGDGEDLPATFARIASFLALGGAFRLLIVVVIHRNNTSTLDKRTWVHYYFGCQGTRVRFIIHQPARGDMRATRKLAIFLKPYWRWAVLAPLLMALEVAMDLLQPRLIERIVDQGMARSDMGVVLSTGLLDAGRGAGRPGRRLSAAPSSRSWPPELRGRPARHALSQGAGALLRQPGSARNRRADHPPDQRCHPGAPRR